MLNVILVTFDSLSARDMSLYGYRRHTTPFIDRFADESYVFENMHANSNSSIPSLASIMTGRYPLKQGSERVRSLLTNRNGAGDLADVLKSNGYRTAAVIGLKAGYLWVNSLVGDGGWMSRMMAGRYGGRSISGATVSLDATFRKTLELLDSACRPFFLWLHIYPPHEPYLPSRSFRGTFVKEKVFDVIGSQRPYFNRFYPETSQPAVDMLRGRYNEHILGIDHNFGGFLGSLERKGILETSMMVVTSDHAEMFERGYQGHNGPLLYDPLLHVPLIVRLPDGRPGRRIARGAEQVDIAPTILDLLGCEIPRHMHGESLAEAMVGDKHGGPSADRSGGASPGGDASPGGGTSPGDGTSPGGGAGSSGGPAPCADGSGGDSAKPRFSVSAAYRTPDGGPRGRSMAVVAKGHKLILGVPSGACELYDLVRDPGESTDLAAQELEMGQDLKEMIFERFATDEAGIRHLLREAG